MVKFCKSCDNLLNIQFKNDELMFMCHICRIYYDSDDTDTLIYERVKNDNMMIFEKILRNASDDPAAIKAYKKCISCNCSIVKQVRIGDQLRLYNICVKCKTQWLY